MIMFNVDLSSTYHILHKTEFKYLIVSRTINLILNKYNDVRLWCGEVKHGPEHMITNLDNVSITLENC